MHAGELVLEHGELVDLAELLEHGAQVVLLEVARDLADEQLDGFRFFRRLLLLLVLLVLLVLLLMLVLVLLLLVRLLDDGRPGDGVLLDEAAVVVHRVARHPRQRQVDGLLLVVGQHGRHARVVHEALLELVPVRVVPALVVQVRQVGRRLEVAGRVVAPRVAIAVRQHVRDQHGAASR